MIGSFQNTLKNTGLILVSADIMDHKLTFIIDTGATHNMVYSNAYNEFKQCFTSTEDIGEIFGLDGIRQKTPVVNADLNIHNKTFKTELVVVSADSEDIMLREYGLKIHGILGVQFLKDNNCVIDFANKTIKIGD